MTRGNVKVYWRSPEGKGRDAGEVEARQRGDDLDGGRGDVERRGRLGPPGFLGGWRFIERRALLLHGRRLVDGAFLGGAGEADGGPEEHRRGGEDDERGLRPPYIGDVGFFDDLTWALELELEPARGRFPMRLGFF